MAKIYYDGDADMSASPRSEEHTSELQSHLNLVCRLLLEKKTNTGRYSTARRSRSLFFLVVCSLIVRTPMRQPHPARDCAPAKPPLCQRRPAGRPPPSAGDTHTTQRHSHRPSSTRVAPRTSPQLSALGRGTNSPSPQSPNPPSPIFTKLARSSRCPSFFFLNDPAPPELSTLPLPAALPT